MRVAAVVDFDINVTYVGDLIRCSRHVLQRERLTKLVGTGCHLDPGVRLVETVVGDNVVISKPMTLERCVAFSGVTLDTGDEYHDAVITQEGVLRPYLQA